MDLCSATLAPEPRRAAEGADRTSGHNGALEPGATPSRGHQGTARVPGSRRRPSGKDSGEESETRSPARPPVRSAASRCLPSRRGQEGAAPPGPLLTPYELQPGAFGGSKPQRDDALHPQWQPGCEAPRVAPWAEGRLPPTQSCRGSRGQRGGDPLFPASRSLHPTICWKPVPRTVATGVLPLVARGVALAKTKEHRSRHLLQHAWSEGQNPGFDGVGVPDLRDSPGSSHYLVRAPAVPGVHLHPNHLPPAERPPVPRPNMLVGVLVAARVLSTGGGWRTDSGPGLGGPWWTCRRPGETASYGACRPLVRSPRVSGVRAPARGP